jgi:hypothetical protein
MTVPPTISRTTQGAHCALHAGLPDGPPDPICGSVIRLFIAPVTAAGNAPQPSPAAQIPAARRLTSRKVPLEWHSRQADSSLLRSKGSNKLEPPYGIEP